MLAGRFGSHVAHLVPPAAIPRHEGVGVFEGDVRFGGSVGVEQLRVVSGESPLMEVVQEAVHFVAPSEST